VVTIADQVKEIARGAAAAAFVPPQLGEVLGANQDAFRVRVRLQPSGIETDWLRVAAPLLKWANVELPEQGDEVLVVSAAGELIVIAQLFNAQDAPPSDGMEVARKGDQVKVTVNGVTAGSGSVVAYGTIEEGSEKVKLVE
jgi:uncharacterized protein involved in type VI secretion and phage assembly